MRRQNCIWPAYPHLPRYSRWSAIFASPIAGVVSILLIASALCAEPRKDRTVVLVSIDGLGHAYLSDPRADVPTLRRLAQDGAVADGMITVFPSVTWTAHATISTGVWPRRHGILANDIIDRQTRQKVTLLCDPVYEPADILRAPTIFEVAHRAGLVTAGVLWPLTRNTKFMHFAAPDMPGDDAWMKFGTPQWIARLREKGLPVDDHGRWCRESGGGVPRDWLYARMARQLLDEHEPNLVLIHLVEPDHVQHRTGPYSGDAYWAASYADDRIRDIWEAILRSPRARSTYLIICSDHGFFPTRRTIQPNVLLRQMGLITVQEGKPIAQEAWCLTQGGAAALYIFDQARRQGLVDELKQRLTKLEGIERVFSGEEFGVLGQATVDEHPWAPDLWLAAKREYVFSEGVTGEQIVVDRPSPGGTHGYLPDHPDMWALCIIWGPGIPAGTRLGRVQLVDLAPTVAHLLGVELPGTDGRPLVSVP
ncbi:MAG: ectonucleotide pyrophosphatase/phosphodiesterase [Thermoguttaceae bacterium]|nr:ectonucleotide pyrophosphatase/phosphodiesterase [Thermoguttaceae bacterium]MDW8078397.1 ectonucleotide pyrophosphatase/phosphodiesterase [Thermoguttaceae bacterium]